MPTRDAVLAHKHSSHASVPSQHPFPLCSPILVQVREKGSYDDQDVHGEVERYHSFQWGIA